MKSYSRVKVVSFILILTSILFVAGGNRVSSIANSKERSNIERMELWKAHFILWVQNPIVGVGYRETSSKLESIYKSTEAVAKKKSNGHNNLLEILAGLGLPGLGIYLLFHLVLLFKLVNFMKLPKVTGGGHLPIMVLASGLLVFQIGGLTESNFVDAESNYNYIFGVALLLGNVDLSGLKIRKQS